MTDQPRYTRVTEVLYPFSGLDKIDAGVVARAGERGTKVHKICEAIAAKLGELGVDEEAAPYVKSFKQWWGPGHKVVAMEKRFYCPKKHFTGQVDFILDTPSGLCIVDLKTSYKCSPTWEAQGSGYSYLAREAGYDIQRIQFIHLSKHGLAPTIYEYPADSSLFLATLTAYNHFYRTNPGTYERPTSKNATAT